MPRTRAAVVPPGTSDATRLSMQPWWTFATLVFIVLAARAEPSLIGLAGDSEVPSPCAGGDEIVTDPERRMTMTMCAATVRLEELAHLGDDVISVLAVEQAAAPSFVVLGELACSADLAVALRARELCAELYLAMAVRLARELDRERNHVVEPHLLHWIASARWSGACTSCEANCSQEE